MEISKDSRDSNHPWGCSNWCYQEPLVYYMVAGIQIPVLICVEKVLLAAEPTLQSQFNMISKCFNFGGRGAVISVCLFLS